MLGFRSSRDEDKSTSDATNLDVAKLFFDSFSKRVNGVEDRILRMSADFEKLKMSVEHGQVSDLVLLDRLQNAEKMIKDTLGSIRTALEQTYTSVPSPRLETDNVQGYIRRDQTRIPFRYSVVDKLKQTVAKKESKDEGKEPISVPQT